MSRVVFLRKFVFTIFVIGLLFFSCNKEKINIDNVFVGDSHIQGWDLAYYFNNNVNFNYGVGGNKVTDVNQRVDNLILEGKKINNCYLMIGSNDVKLSFKLQKRFITQFSNEFSNLIDKLKLISDNVYVIQPIPSSKEVILAKDRVAYIGVFNEISDNIKHYKGIKYIELPNYLLKDNFLDEKFTEDGVHLNLRGYEILSDEVRLFMD